MRKVEILVIELTGFEMAGSHGVYNSFEGCGTCPQVT